MGTPGPQPPAGPPRQRQRRERIEPPAIGATHKLQKVLAQAGFGSRRDMETLIESGKVTVNGARALLGARVGEHDRIEIDGRVVRTRSAARMPRVLIYHKPEGEITSRDDPRGRPSVFERLPTMAGAKWVSVGRLDFNTCGLLLFTTSGELANRMMHPRFEIEREYAVRVMAHLQPQHLERLTQGVELDDGLARCVTVDPRGGEGANQWCHVVMNEGRNRIVRRLFGALGLTVSRLMRVRYGIIGLPPRLKRGQFQELSADETRRLLAWLDAGEAPAQPVRARSARGRGARG